MFARSALAALLLIVVSSPTRTEAQEPVIFRINVTNHAGWGFPSAPIYADDSFSTGWVTSGEWESNIDISRSIVTGHSTIRIQLERGVLTAEWDFSHAHPASNNFYDIWNPVTARVNVEMRVPRNHVVQWQARVEKTSSGTRNWIADFRKGDPAGTKFPDGVTTYGGSGKAGPFYWVPNPVIYDGHDYFMAFDYWNTADGSWRVESLRNVFGRPRADNFDLNATATLNVRNLTMPLPQITVSANELNFDDAVWLYHESDWKPIVITNVGQAGSVLRGIVNFPGIPPFVYDGVGPFELLAGESKQIRVKFAPGATHYGTNQQTIAVSSDDPDPDDRYLAIEINAVGKGASPTNLRTTGGARTYPWWFHGKGGSVETTFLYNSSCGHIEHLDGAEIRERLTATPATLPPPFVGELPPGVTMHMAWGPEGRFNDRHGPDVLPVKPYVEGKYSIAQEFIWSAPWTRAADQNKWFLLRDLTIEKGVKRGKQVANGTWMWLFYIKLLGREFLWELGLGPY